MCCVFGVCVVSCLLCVLCVLCGLCMYSGVLSIMFVPCPGGAHRI